MTDDVWIKETTSETVWQKTRCSLTIFFLQIQVDFFGKANQSDTDSETAFAVGLIKVSVACVLSDNGSCKKKKCQQNCLSVFYWSLLLFYSDMVHKQWPKVWFLTSQMLVLSGGINLVPFWTTSKKKSKIPMKYSKNGQIFVTSKNTSNMLFETCKKPHFSRGLDHDTLFFEWPVICTA